MGIEGNSARLLVAVPTFRRNSELAVMLPRVLSQLQAVSPGRQGELLVVDNDPEAGARATVEDFPTVRYVHEPVPGIAAARNRALDEATGSDVLVFIDDDEMPRDGWLKALLETWRSTGADAVMGRVVTVFPADATDPWVSAGRFFRRPSHPTGTVLGVAATGNLLLDLGALRRTGLRFNVGLGLAGGEDTLFTRQLVKHGCRIVWCEESVAEDRIASARLDRPWLLRRARGHGSVAITTELIMADGVIGRTAVRLGGVLGGTARIALGRSRQAWGLLTRNWTDRARGARTANRGMGMLSAAMGQHIQEYVRDH